MAVLDKVAEKKPVGVSSEPLSNTPQKGPKPSNEKKILEGSSDLNDGDHKFGKSKEEKKALIVSTGTETLIGQKFIIDICLNGITSIMVDSTLTMEKPKEATTEEKRAKKENPKAPKHRAP